MHVHVRSQRRLDREAFAALRADVLSRLGVGGLVVLQLLLRDESFPTVWEAALVWLVAGMTVYVSGEFGLIPEGLRLTATRPMAIVVSARLCIPLLPCMV